MRVRCVCKCRNLSGGICSVGTDDFFGRRWMIKIKSPLQGCCYSEPRSYADSGLQNVHLLDLFVDIHSNRE